MKTMKIILTLILMISSPCTLASMCASIFLNLSDDSFDRAKEYADVIFKGEAVFSVTTVVREKGKERWIREAKTKFDGVTSIKGDSEPSVFINDNDACSCRKEFETGVNYVVFAKIDADGKHKTFDCNFIFLEEAYNEIIADG